MDYSSPSEVVIPVSSGPSMFCFNIVIIDDRVAFEGDEEVLVSFEIATGSEAQVEGSFSILILDNDGEYCIWTLPHNLGHLQCTFTVLGNPSLISYHTVQWYWMAMAL